MQLVAPEFAAKVPAAQFTQVLAAISAYCPALQLMHVAEAIAPIIAEANPEAQFVHMLAAALDAYEPTPHGLQLDDATEPEAATKVPAAQPRQALAPVDTWYCPAGHEAQTTEFANEYDPAEQAAQLEDVT